MHIPEAQLRDYLRVFVPDGDVEAELDRIAEIAIAESLQDELGFFQIAHRRFSGDARVTPQMEAAVLVAEVGLDHAQVATVLRLPIDEVEKAVTVAWQEAGAPAAPPEPPRTRRWPALGLILLLVCVLAVVVALLGSRSSAGSQALADRGIDPAWAIAAAVLLLVTGVTALAAGRALERRRFAHEAAHARVTAAASDAPASGERRSAPASPPTSPG